MSAEKDQPEKKNLHSGHRQRMIERYLKNGIDCFAPHEVLEILLFAAYTRQNTNNIAHRLIDRFGSLEGVMNAEFAELTDVDGVGNTAAALIKFINDFARTQYAETPDDLLLDNTERVREYCFSLLKNSLTEETYVLFLNKAMRLTKKLQLSRSGRDFTDIDLHTIVSHSINSHCSHVILVHCHPHGTTIASSADVASTRRVAMLLKNIGISLLDHIIVGRYDTYSMRAAGMLKDIWD